MRVSAPTATRRSVGPRSKPTGPPSGKWTQRQAPTARSRTGACTLSFRPRFTTFPLDGEAFPAPAGALRVRVVEHKAGGEIIFAPVHDRSTEIQHRSAVDVKIAAWSLDLLVEGLFLGHIVDRIREPRAAAARSRQL